MAYPWGSLPAHSPLQLFFLFAEMEKEEKLGVDEVWKREE